MAENDIDTIDVLMDSWYSYAPISVPLAYY